MHSFKTFLCFLASFLLIYKSSSTTVDHIAEEQLFKDLFEDYNPLTRPEKTTNPVGTVIRLREIIDIDEKNQIMTSAFTLEHGWWDKRFKWNLSEYNNINNILVPAKKVWIPDTFINNIVGSDGFIFNQDSLTVSINYMAMCHIHVPLYSVKTTCALNFKNYPFDSQKCGVEFRPWSLSRHLVNLYDPYNIKKVFLEDFTPNIKWTLKDTSIENFNVPNVNPFEDEGHSLFKFEVYLKRNSNSFMSSVIAPFYLINAATIICFFLPYSKQIICWFLCNLAFYLNYMRVSMDIPFQPNDPLKINKFFALSFALNAIPILWFLLCNLIKTRDILPNTIFKAFEYMALYIKFVRHVKNDTRVHQGDIEICSISGEPSKEKCQKFNKDRKELIKGVLEIDNKGYENVFLLINFIFMLIFTLLVIISYVIYWQWFNKK